MPGEPATLLIHGILASDVAQRNDRLPVLAALRSTTRRFAPSLHRPPSPAQDGPINSVAGSPGIGEVQMGTSLSSDDIEALAKAIAREVVRELTALASPPVVVQPKRTVFEVGPITVDVDRHEVTVEEKLVAYKPREFALIEALARNAGRVLTREAILAAAWPEDVAMHIDDRTVDVHIRRVRAALGVHRDRIETISGLGYRLRDR